MALTESDGANTVAMKITNNQKFFHTRFDKRYICHAVEYKKNNGEAKTEPLTAIECGGPNTVLIIIVK